MKVTDPNFQSKMINSIFDNFFQIQKNAKILIIILGVGRTSFPDKPCPVKTELSNVTFIEGINSGNFTDMGHVATFDQCKQKCCQDSRCNIAFKIQDDCYGVACHSRESCRTRPAKNANIFSPEMALMRSVHETLEQSKHPSCLVRLKAISSYCYCIIRAVFLQPFVRASGYVDKFF